MDRFRKLSRWGYHVLRFKIPETHVRFPIRGTLAYDILLVKIQGSASPVEKDCSCFCRHNGDLITYAVVEIQIHAMWRNRHGPTQLDLSSSSAAPEYS